MTVVRTTSHRVAPSASAASICERGVWQNTSRVTAVMIGRIITASTMPAVKIVPPPAIEPLPVANSGNQPRFSFSHTATGLIAGAKHEQAPQAEDDRRHGGEQVDHVRERPREPLAARTG